MELSFFFAFLSLCSRPCCADVVDGVCVFSLFFIFVFLPSPSFKFELTKNKNEQNLFALRSRLLFAIAFFERDKHVLFLLSASRVAFFICNSESCNVVVSLYVEVSYSCMKVYIRTYSLRAGSYRLFSLWASWK